MAIEPLSGITIPTSADPPANFGAQIAEAFGGAAPMWVLPFADEAERDARLPNPRGGAKVWLDNPGDYFSYYPGKGWRPDSMPGPGDTSTVQRSVIAEGDLTFADPSNATFGGQTTIDVPQWAQTYGGRARVFAELQTPIDKGASGDSTSFRMDVEYSLDGGGSWQNSKDIYYKGIDLTAGSVFSLTDEPNTLGVAGVTGITVRFRVVSRFKGDGTLRRDAANTMMRYTATFEPLD